MIHDPNRIYFWQLVTELFLFCVRNIPKANILVVVVLRPQQQKSIVYHHAVDVIVQLEFLHFDIDPLSRSGPRSNIKLDSIWLRQMENFVLLNRIGQRLNCIFAFKMQNCVQKVHESVFAVKQRPECGITPGIEIFLPLELFPGTLDIVYTVVCFEQALVIYIHSKISIFYGRRNILRPYR